MKPIPDEPREMWVIKKAREFIRAAGICWLPVNPIEVARKFGWQVLTAGQVAMMSGMPRSEVLSGLDSDVYYWPGGGKYKIIYNERAYPLRIPYSIAHEIGHIVLNHLEDFNQTRLSRGGLTDAEYWVLEREAEIFAAELLMPLPILRALLLDKPIDIMRVCKVSRSTASLRSIEIRRSYVADDLDDDYWMRKQFGLYLRLVPVCTNCTSERFVGPEKRLPGVMYITRKLLYVETDGNGRFLVCPKCGNTKISKHAAYCRMCGTYLYNTCTNEPENQWRSECGKVNPGDARYCEYCGAPTRLMELGLLMSWEEVIKAYKEVAVGLEPASKMEHVAEDGLPF